MISSLISYLAIVPNACRSDFFGLRPWYYYFDKDQFSAAPDCAIKNFSIRPSGGHSDIALILAAIVDDLLRIAGFIAVVFVIVGAIRYITSQGNPEDTAKAQETILNALVGLLVAIIGVAFISFIGRSIG